MATVDDKAAAQAQGQANHVISDLLVEDRTFDPPEKFVREAVVKDPDVRERAAADPEAFWAGLRLNSRWFKPWDKVLEWEPPHAKWFVGGKLNASYNCLDRHVLNGKRNKAAIIWEGEPGDRRVLTYWDLYREVNKFANALKKPGRQEGRPGRHLHAHDPGGRRRHAGLRAHRRGALGGLRRISAPSRCATASTTPRPSC